MGSIWGSSSQPDDIERRERITEFREMFQKAISDGEQEPVDIAEEDVIENNSWWMEKCPRLMELLLAHKTPVCRPTKHQHGRNIDLVLALRADGRIDQALWTESGLLNGIDHYSSQASLIIVAIYTPNRLDADTGNNNGNHVDDDMTFFITPEDLSDTRSLYNKRVVSHDAGFLTKK